MVLSNTIKLKIFQNIITRIFKSNQLVHAQYIALTVLCAVCICCLLAPGFATATEDVTWVTVESAAPIVNNNIEQARELAIEMAESKAIDMVVIANISFETLLVNLKMSGNLVGAIPYGKIVESVIVEETGKNKSTTSETSSSAMYTVRMKVGVVEKVSGHDPEFKIQARLNRTHFVNGEEMQIHLSPTKDCFYCIFILLEDQKVLKLIPNQFRPNNFLESNTAYTIPDDEDRQKGIILKVQTPEDKSVVKEAVYILALKQPFDFDNTDIKEGIFGIYSGQATFLEDLVRQIAGIPLEDRAEHLIQYQITKTTTESSG